MWHFRLFGATLAVVALSGFIESQTALAVHPASPEFSGSQSQETRGLVGSFQLAVMGNNVVPLDMPSEKSSEKAQPEKPVIEKPKATPKKASKPKKKKVRKAKTKVKKAPVKKPEVVEEEGFLAKTLKSLVGDDNKDSASISLLQKSADGKSEPDKNEGLLTKTLKSLVSDGDDKKRAAPKPKLQKTAEKKAEPGKKEEGLLTKTFKSIMGGDKKKEEQTAKKSALDPINMVSTGSSTKKKTEEPSKTKTAKSETKATLKDSFEKLIGMGNVKDKKEAQPEKNKKFAAPLGGDGPKSTKKLVKAEETVEKTPKRAKLTARKYNETEEDQLEKDRGGTEKGQNVLKDSFKKLVTEEKKKALVE